MLLHSLDPGLPQLPPSEGKVCYPGSSLSQEAEAQGVEGSTVYLSGGQTETAPEWRKPMFLYSVNINNVCNYRDIRNRSPISF